jgi:hypothetical protein
VTKLWAGRCGDCFAACVTDLVQGVHLAFYSVGIGYCFQGVRPSGLAGEHSSPSRAEIRKR